MCPLWVGTSWKMNKGLAEARRYVRGLSEHLGRTGCPGVQPFVIPSFTAVAAARDELGADSPVLLGAQNAHWEDDGAWTGEVSVAQAKDAGAQLVEIGHSERREHFGETVATTRLKVAAVVGPRARPPAVHRRERRGQTGRRILAIHPGAGATARSTVSRQSS